MPDLVFTIKTPAELQGAQETELILGKAIGKAKALGQEYSALEQRLAATKQSIAAYKSENADASKGTDKLGEGLDEAGKKTKLFEGHSRELRKTIRELSHEFPIAGLALRAFATPIAAALTVAIGTFVLFKRHIDEMNAELDSMEQSAARPFYNIKTALIAVSEQLEKLHHAQADYYKATFIDDQAAKKASDLRLQKINEETEAQIRLLKALEALELARAGDDEVKKAAIKLDFAFAENRARGGGEDQQLAELNKTRGGLATDEKAAQSALTKAVANEQNATRLAEIEKLKQLVAQQADDAKVNIPKLREKEKAADEGIRGDQVIARAISEHTTVQKVLEEFAAERAKVKADLKLAVQQESGAAGDSPNAIRLRNLQEEQTQATRQADAARKAVADLIQELRRLDQAIAELVQKVNIERPAREKETQLNTQAEAIKAAEEQKKKDAAERRRLGQDADHQLKGGANVNAPESLDVSAIAQPLVDEIAGTTAGVKALADLLAPALKDLRSAVDDAGARIDDSFNV